MSAIETRKTLSPVRFNYNICRIAAISRDFRRNEARFLCLVDCVAEREEFESATQRSFNNLQSTAGTVRHYKALQVTLVDRKWIAKISRSYCDQLVLRNGISM